MKKDLIFFATSDDKVSLTSTSANHIANLAKEYVQTSENVLNSIKLFNTSMSLVGSSAVTPISYGITKESLDRIPELIKEISSAKALIAWLREAIKAKESFASEVRHLSIADWAAQNNITLPEEPEEGNILTEDEYYGNLSIKERNRYYQLETLCAVIGKYIHPNGEYANARKELKNKIENPNEVRGNGRDTLIYSYTPTVQISDIEDMFFKLQKEHREAQAALNSIKHECDQAIEDSRIKVEEAYEKALADYRTKFMEIKSAFETARSKELQRIKGLKIRIPDSLLVIYSKISSLGK